MLLGFRLISDPRIAWTPRIMTSPSNRWILGPGIKMGPRWWGGEVENTQLDPLDKWGSFETGKQMKETAAPGLNPHVCPLWCPAGRFFPAFYARAEIGWRTVVATMVSYGIFSPIRPSVGQFGRHRWAIWTGWNLRLRGSIMGWCGRWSWAWPSGVWITPLIDAWRIFGGGARILKVGHIF